MTSESSTPSSALRAPHAGLGTLHVLQVEDSPGDVRLVCEMLRQAPGISLEAVDSLAAALTRLAKGGIDLVLLDLGLPDSQSLETLRRLRQAVPGMAVVVLTGNDDHELAVAAVREGAQDYLVKGQFVGNLLVRAARYAIERKRTEDERQALLDGVQQERNRLSALVDGIADEVWFADAQGRFALANPPALHEFGLARGDTVAVEALAKSLEVLRADGSPRPVAEAPPLRALAGETVRNEEELVRTPASGELRCRQVSSTPVRDPAGRIVGSVSVVRDITERKRAEAELAASEVRYRRLFESAKDGILILDAETGAVVDVNPFLVELLGYPREEFVGKKVWELGFFRDIIANQANFAELQQEGYIRYEDKPLEARDGRRIEVEFVSNVYQADHHRVIQCNIRDITTRKRAESNQRLAAAVLAVLNRPNDRTALIHDILVLVKARTGVGAVAVRLRDGDDYPYFVQNGLSEGFAVAETHLCERTPTGEIVRDSKGNAVLECMCGSILRGRTDPALPCFTPGGSFWTNSTTALLASTPEKDRQAGARNRCHGEGYESVALIPLRSGDEIIGLLQLNDSRRGCFSEEMIRFLEGLGNSIGIAMARLAMTETLRHETEFNRSLIDTAQAIVLVLDPQGRIVQFNPYLEELSGYRLGDVQGKDWFDTFVPEPARESTRALFGGAIRGIRTHGNVSPVVTKDGHERLIEWYDKTLRGAEGRTVGLLAVGQDVTERQRAADERVRAIHWQQGANGLQQALLAAVPIEDRLRAVTEGIVRVFGADFCRIWLIRPGDLCERDCVHAAVQEGPHVCRLRGKCLHLLASSGRYTHTDGTVHRRVPFGCYKIGRIASGEEHRFLTNDVQNDPRVHNHEWARELGLVSFAGYQLRVPDGETLGVLALFAKHPIVPAEDAVLDGLGSAVAMAVRQATAEDARTAMQAQLVQSQKLEAIGTLAGGVAHEINNPINGVMNYAQLIVDGLGDRDAELTGYAGEILHETERVATIVRNLLSFARHDTRDHSPARVEDIVEATLSLTRAVIRHDQITLEVDVPADLPAITCRSQQIQQVLMNLLTNARDALNEKYPGFHDDKRIRVTAVAMDSGLRAQGSAAGPLESAAPGAAAGGVQNVGGASRLRQGYGGQARRRPVSVDLAPCGRGVEAPPTLDTLDTGPSLNPQSGPRRWVRLTVEDHGPGIPPDLRERIFDPFFTTKPRGKGTGLGLSISHSLVTGHGGALTFESEPGQWTRFHVDLPVDGGEAAEGRGK